MGRHDQYLGPLMGLLLGFAAAQSGAAASERAVPPGSVDTGAPSSSSQSVTVPDAAVPMVQRSGRPAPPAVRRGMMAPWPLSPPWGGGQAAGSPWNPPGPAINPFMMPVYPESALTPSQRTGIRVIRHEARLQHHQLQGELLRARQALEDALLTSRPEPEAVGAVFARFFDIQRRMIELRLRTVNAITDRVRAAGDVSAPQ